MKVYLFCSFHLRKLFRQQPITALALLSAAFAVAVALAVMLYWSARHSAAGEALRVAQQSLPVQPAEVQAPQINEVVTLPAFSSAALTAQFLSIAKDVGLATDEVSYSLESGPAQPYWRYRINFEVKSGYPQIRKFVAAMASEQPNVVLDAIRCKRDEITTVPLTCELTLSAFFRRSDRG